jgi:hypothetical protein
MNKNSDLYKQIVKAQEAMLEWPPELKKDSEYIPIDSFAENSVMQPPKPPLMRVGCNGESCPLCGSGMKPNRLFFKSKGCYQPECENYWKNKE